MSKSHTSKFFRNKIPVQGIDEEALWELHEGGEEPDLLILTDEDQFIYDYPNPDIFYEVEKPDNLLSGQ